MLRPAHDREVDRRVRFAAGAFHLEETEAGIQRAAKGQRRLRRGRRIASRDRVGLRPRRDWCLVRNKTWLGLSQICLTSHANRLRIGGGVSMSHRLTGKLETRDDPFSSILCLRRAESSPAANRITCNAAKVRGRRLDQLCDDNVFSVERGKNGSLVVEGCDAAYFSTRRSSNWTSSGPSWSKPVPRLQVGVLLRGTTSPSAALMTALAISTGSNPSSAMISRTPCRASSSTTASVTFINFLDHAQPPAD
jgi:hypothetical protein